jgi:hypothetical protein
MAFNVGLFLVMAYTCWRPGNAITIGFLLDTVANMQGHRGPEPAAVHHPGRSCSWPG